MHKEEFKYDTIITADRGKYLRIVNNPEAEEIFGKPERIIFSNQGIIPEFEEVELEGPVHD